MLETVCRWKWATAVTPDFRHTLRSRAGTARRTSRCASSILKNRGASKRTTITSGGASGIARSTCSRPLRASHLTTSSPLDLRRMYCDSDLMRPALSSFGNRHSDMPIRTGPPGNPVRGAAPDCARRSSPGPMPLISAQHRGRLSTASSTRQARSVTSFALGSETRMAAWSGPTFTSTIGPAFLP